MGGWGWNGVYGMHSPAVGGRIVGLGGGEGVCIRGGFEGGRERVCVGVRLSSRFGIEDRVTKIGCRWG